MLAKKPEMMRVICYPAGTMEVKSLPIKASEIAQFTGRGTKSVCEYVNIHEGCGVKNRWVGHDCHGYTTATASEYTYTVQYVKFVLHEQEDF